MGCFNVAGSLSKISIDNGERVVFIPLIPTWFNVSVRYKRELKATIEPTSFVCSNEGSNALYDIMFLPIRGEYDHYGTIENIDRDENVEAMEDYFGIDIDSIIQGIRDYRTDGYNQIEAKTPELTNVLLHTAGMFELEEIYDKAVQHGKDTNPLVNSWQLDEYKVLQMGLIEESENIFVIPNNDRLKIDLTDYRYKVFIDGKSIKPLYGVSDVIKCFDKVGYTIPKQPDNVSNFYYTIRSVKHELDKLNNHPLLEKLTGENLQDFKLALRFGNKDSLDRLLTGMYDSLRFVVDNEKLFDKFEDLLCFRQFMTFSNSLFMPANNGAQHGCIDTTKQLLEMSTEYIDNRIQWLKDEGCY